MNKKATIANVKRLTTDVCPHFDKVILRADADISFLDEKRLTNEKAENRPPDIKCEETKINCLSIS
jgi:hypothetical protein